MENLFTGADNSFFGSHCADASQAIELIDTLNIKAGREAFGLCLDTGHLHLARVDMRGYIPRLAHRIKCLHIDDNFGFADSHLEPFGGNIPWDHFCSLLKDIHYRHTLNFEIAHHVPRPLLPAFLKYVVEIGKYFDTQINA